LKFSELLARFGPRVNRRRRGKPVRLSVRPLRAHNKTPIYAANIGCAGKPHHHCEFILEMLMHRLNPCAPPSAEP
jgi:hypothetical protein